MTSTMQITWHLRTVTLVLCHCYCFVPGGLLLVFTSCSLTCHDLFLVHYNHTSFVFCFPLTIPCNCIHGVFNRHTVVYGKGTELYLGSNPSSGSQELHIKSSRQSHIEKDQEAAALWFWAFAFTVVVWSFACTPGVGLDDLLLFKFKDSGRCSIPKFTGTGILNAGGKRALSQAPFKLQNWTVSMLCGYTGSFQHWIRVFIFYFPSFRKE